MAALGKGQDSYAPYGTDGSDQIQSRGAQSREVSIDGIVEVVDGRQDGPDPIYLRVVLVDLGDEEENRSNDQREGGGCNEGIRVKVELFQGGQVGE